MDRYTQKQLKSLVINGTAIDVTYSDNEDRERILKDEGYLNQIGYSAGIYGCNGILLKGHNTGKLYAVTSRTSAIFIFG